MKDIKWIAEFIKEEMEDSEKYAKKAMHYKDTDKELADMYARLSEEEIRHGDMLHAQVVRLIKEHKAKGNTAPESMMAIWDWEHGKIIEHKARVKTMLEMYKT